MSNSYYYFIASLPMLSWGAKPLLSSVDFLSDCQRLLADEDYVLIRDLLDDEKVDVNTKNASAQKWIQFDRDFRNEIVKFRAQKLNKDSQKFIRGFGQGMPDLKEVIHQTSKMTNLLEAEKVLDQLRWQFLDVLISGHHYDLECVFVYGIKLKILERYGVFASSQGHEVFEEIKHMEFPESCVL